MKSVIASGVGLAVAEDTVLLQVNSKGVSSDIFHTFLDTPEGEVEARLELHLDLLKDEHHHDKDEGHYHDEEHHFEEDLDKMIAEIMEEESIPFEEFDAGVMEDWNDDADYDYNYEEMDAALAEVHHITVEEEHFEDITATAAAMHVDDATINEAVEAFEAVAEPHQEEFHDCKSEDDITACLPSMEEDRCARQCAWEQWVETDSGNWEPAGVLTIDNNCYQVCKCADDFCSDRLPEDFQFYDHHSGNHDYDWMFFEDVMRETGWRDCERKECHHFWDADWHCGVDWSIQDAWVNNIVGEVHGIEIQAWQLSEEAAANLGCDPMCEANRACEQHCRIEAEPRCGFFEDREMTCANHEGASDWCKDCFWSCKWETQPQECECWNMDEERIAELSTCDPANATEGSMHGGKYLMQDNKALKKHVAKLASVNKNAAKAFLKANGIGKAMLRK